MPQPRTERDVLAELGEDARRLLKRVLEIEKGRLHVDDPDLTDDILDAVKGVVK
jgi:hypothetical protein